MAVVSAAIFGTLAILAKIGYSAGLSVSQLLAVRFLIAGGAMVIIATGFQRNRPNPSKLGLLVLLGAGCYGGQSLLFFTALRSLPAALVELVLYVYPALVTVAAWLLYRRQISRLQTAALLASLAGVGLLLGGAPAAGGPGLALALAAPLAYTVYLLISERVMANTPALQASAALMLGAALFWVIVARAQGQLAAPPSTTAWLVVVAFAVGPSMISIPLLLAALPRIGSDRVAILSTCEPLVTVLLAVGYLGERMASLQVAGAVLVLLAIVVVQWPHSPIPEPVSSEIRA